MDNYDAIMDKYKAINEAYRITSKKCDEAVNAACLLGVGGAIVSFIGKTIVIAGGSTVILIGYLIFAEIVIIGLFINAIVASINHHKASAYHSKLIDESKNGETHNDPN